MLEGALVWERRACCGREGAMCAEGMDQAAVDDATVVTPESLGRTAEVGNCVEKRSGPGDTLFLLRLTVS